MFLRATTLSDGKVLSGETVETTVTEIFEQLKKLPPENQTEEAITYILDTCIRRIKSKQLIL